MLVSLFFPATAVGDAARVEGDLLRVVAGAGEANAVAVAPADPTDPTMAPGSLAVTDAGAPLTAGSGCIGTSSGALSCGPPIAAVEVDLGDGGDTLTVVAGVPTRAAGGAGDDVLNSGAGADLLDGGPGDDQLDGGDGDDRDVGGDGDDLLTGGPGADVLLGDHGADVADGGPGDDVIEVRDSKPDITWCGPERDRVRAEVLDSLDFECEQVDYGPPGRVGRLLARSGGGRFVPIPGQSWASVDRRILPDVLYLIRRYHIAVTDGFATKGHKPLGEHPLGLATDIIPGPGGTWSDVARLARWAEPRQNHPRPPWRWVGWNGDPNHGDPQHCTPSRGCPPHLHLSWAHSPGRPLHPVDTVWVLDVRIGVPGAL
jgi:hypothetical protein